jgi:hypothetical protein
VPPFATETGAEKKARAGFRIAEATDSWESLLEPPSDDRTERYQQLSESHWL